MKKLMKFAAMAVAAIALCVSCQEKPENTDPEPDATPLSIEGKQWKFSWTLMGGVDAVLDLGATTSGTLTMAVDASAMGDPSLAGKYIAYINGNYTLTATDATSGSFEFSDPMDPTGTKVSGFYSDLTENSVKVTITSLGLENCEMTLMTDKVTFLQ